MLKTYEYSETSKILRLLTRDRGLCSVIAKGARRPKSRFGGLLEPFTDGVATFYVKEGRELHTLSGFELVRERQALGRELVRYAGAGLLTEIVLRVAPAAPDRALFARLRRGLDRLLEEDGDVEAAILEETWRLIACLGFAPAVDRCAECGAEAPPDRAVLFDLSGGGLVCESCRRDGGRRHVRSLDAGVRAELAALVAGATPPGVRLRTLPAQRDLLREFVAHHVAEHRQLNSFRFLDRGMIR